MSRVVVGGSSSSQRTRAKTSAANPFDRPSECTLPRSRSVDALGKSAPSNADRVTVPVGRESGSIGRGGLGNNPSDSSPAPVQEARREWGVVEGSKGEHAKTLVKSTGVGGLGIRHRKLSSGGSGDSQTSTLTSITARVRPKLTSLTNLARRKSQHTSKSASATPSTKTLAQMDLIRGKPEEPVPPPPASFARPAPREPVIRKSISLYDTKGEVKALRATPSKSNTLATLPPRKSSLRRVPSCDSYKREVTPSYRNISHSPVEEGDEDFGPGASPIRTVNRYATVYAPAPSIPFPSSSSSGSAKHFVKPSLSLTLPNGISSVHEPLLLSPIAPSVRSTISTLAPPSRPPPRAHLPESPNPFASGFDIKPEAWDASAYPPPPSATSIASYYYTSTEANADYHDVITRYIERGDMESVQGHDSIDIHNNRGWAAPSPQPKLHHTRSSGSPKSPAQLIPLDRQSMLPTPEPIGGGGKFPPLPPPPKLNKKLPATPREEPDEDGDEFTQVLRLLRSPSSRSRLTPVTPDTPALLTPKSNTALPALAPLRSEEEISRWSDQEEVPMPAKQPSPRIRSKRTLHKAAASFLPTAN